MKKWIVMMVLLMAGVGYCLTELPFPLLAAQKLAAYAKDNGYTATQVKNAPPAVVFSHLGIKADSAVAKKYLLFEDVIKGHAVNLLGLEEKLSLKDEVLSLIWAKYPNATIKQGEDATQYIIDLDGK